MRKNYRNNKSQNPKPDLPTLRFLLTALVVLSMPLGFFSCKPEQAEPPKSVVEKLPAAPSPVAPAPGPHNAAEAFEAYQSARRAFQADDMGEVRRQLYLAVAIKPDFTEAWYNLGAANSNLAVEEMQAGREVEAAALFREAVGNKKTARSLIEQGKWFVYKTRREQEMVKSDLANALEDVDEVLADEKSLMAALKIWAVR